MTAVQVSPLAMPESNTSEIAADAIHAIAKLDSLRKDSESMYSEGSICDLFERVHTLHQARQSILITEERPRGTTMGGFVVNKTTLLKFYLDEKNYVTIPIRPNTKAIDAIQTIIHRRRLPQSTQCILYQDNQEIDTNANLHEIMQITSGTSIQVRFNINDDDNIKKDHHLIHSLTNHDQDDDNQKTSAPSPYSIQKQKRVIRRAFPNKLNLIAFNSFSIQSDDNDVTRDQVLQKIECSLKQIPRQQYNVIKINKYNKHQKRILKLTQHGIENIKPATSGLFNTKEECVTSFHSWENITNAYLEDSKTIRISYKDYKDGDRRYQTLEANGINESIQKRLKIIRDQKTSAGRQEISIKFQKKLINQQINNNNIFNMNDHVRLTRNRSGYIVYKGFVHYAPGDHYGIELDDDNGDHDGYYDGIRYFRTDPKRAVIVPDSHIIRKTIIKKQKLTTDQKREFFPSFSQNSQMKISSPFLNGGVPSNAKINVTPGVISVEDNIFKELKAMILSSDTTEGKYRLNFMNKFHNYSKEENLLELVREFMNAVKTKIHTKYAVKYKELILESWHRNDDDIKGPQTNDEIANEMSMLSDSVNTLIESAIEQTILQAKIKEIYVICMDKTQSETQILSLKIERLRHRNQHYFGIKDELESATNWNRAVYELSLLRDCSLPSEKIRSLVNCAHAIYLNHAKEQREKEKSIRSRPGTPLTKSKYEEYFITGDDFLPIVIYVIVQASKMRACITDADLRFMEGLVDPAVNRSEPGYYLAVFHAALQWIRCFNN